MDYRFIEIYRERVEHSLEIRGADFDLKAIDQIGEEKRRLQTEHDEKKAKLNALSSEIGKLVREKGNLGQSERLREETSKLKLEVQITLEKLARIEETLKDKLLYLPNVLHESVEEGKNSTKNALVRVWGEPKNPVPHPKNHDEIGQKLDILDFERASRVSGARFVFLKGWGARLERALINFMMDLHQERGYIEIIPPYLVNRSSMIGTGQLPKFAEEAFKIENPEFYLVPTAEVPVTNLYRDEILQESDLPMSFVAYSACFRREAGSYGRDTKGLIRQHQFNKVELVKFTRPHESYEALERLTLDAEEVLKRLELPYRVVSLCSGDIGFSAAKTYDLEVWLPGHGEYREISSCSNCEEFQARRAGIRFKPKGGGKPHFVHTLNGSGLAVGRTLIAILENGQRENGSVAIPSALSSYLGGAREIS